MRRTSVSAKKIASHSSFPTLMVDVKALRYLKIRAEHRVVTRGKGLSVRKLKARTLPSSHCLS